jgi:hypothetical protein
MYKKPDGSPTFVSTLAAAEGNVCPAGGKHESASDFPIARLYESDQPYEAQICCCKKCSSVYWLRKKAS